MKKLLFIFAFLLTVAVGNAYSQNNYIFEVTPDTIMKTSFNPETNVYDLSKTELDSTKIYFIEYNSLQFIVKNENIIRVKDSDARDGMLYFTNNENIIHAFGLAYYTSYYNKSDLFKKYLSIDYHRVVRSKHYYNEDFDIKILEFKKLFKKLPKEDKKEIKDLNIKM